MPVNMVKKDLHNSMLSLQREPWSLLLKAVGMHPRNIDYVKEIVWRADFLSHIVSVPHPSSTLLAWYLLHCSLEQDLPSSLMGSWHCQRFSQHTPPPLIVC